MKAQGRPIFSPHILPLYRWCICAQTTRSGASESQKRSTQRPRPNSRRSAPHTSYPQVMILLTQIHLPEGANTSGHKTLPDGRKSFFASDTKRQQSRGFPWLLSFSKNVQRGSNFGVLHSAYAASLRWNVPTPDPATANPRTCQADSDTSTRANSTPSSARTAPQSPQLSASLRRHPTAAD